MLCVLGAAVEVLPQAPDQRRLGLRPLPLLHLHHTVWGVGGRSMRVGYDQLGLSGVGSFPRCVAFCGDSMRTGDQLGPSVVRSPHTVGVARNMRGDDPNRAERCRVLG